MASSRLSTPASTPTSTSNSHARTPTSPPSSPSPRPESISIGSSIPRSSSFPGKGRKPLPPDRLAKLANALGVSIPLPVSHAHSYQNLRSPVSASTTAPPKTHVSRYLLHVIPPIHLPHDQSDDGEDSPGGIPSASGYHTQFRRGTLVPLHSTLQAQLIAIAREYALPSTAGMLLYLFSNASGEDSLGPRISDETWKLLWFQALTAERNDAIAARNQSGSLIRSLSLASSQSSPSFTSPGFPPPPTPTPSDDLRRRPSPSPELDSDTQSLEVRPLQTASPSPLLPILAKVEFDIDRRKAPWYDVWRRRREAASPALGNGPLKLQLPLRSRSVSPAFLTFKDRNGTKASATDISGSEQGEEEESVEAPSLAESRALEDLSDEAAPEDHGYAPLDGAVEGEAGEVAVEVAPPSPSSEYGPEGADPLGDVFPSDEATWRGMAGDSSRGSQSVGLGIASTPAELDEAAQEMEEEGEEEVEDVVSLWNAQHKPTMPLALNSDGKRPILPRLSLPRSEAVTPDLPSDTSLPYLGASPDGDAPQLAEQEALGRETLAEAEPEGSTPVSFDGDDMDDADSRSSEQVMRKKLDELERALVELSPRELNPEPPEVDMAALKSPRAPGFATERKDPVPHMSLGASADSSQAPAWPAVPFSATVSTDRSSLNFPTPASPPTAARKSGPLVSPPRIVATSRPGSSLDPNESRVRKIDNNSQEVLLPPLVLPNGSSSPSPISPMIPLSPDPFSRREPDENRTRKLSEESKNRFLENDIPPAVPSRDTSPPRSAAGTPGSRFSADSMAEEATFRERSNSIMSVKSIRRLWRRSNRDSSKATQPPTPVSLSLSGGVSPPPPPSKEPSPIPPVPSPRPQQQTHNRSDSGLDPFHFDQDSRYPVLRSPSPSHTTPIFREPSPPTVASLQKPPSPPSGRTRGILKSWSRTPSSAKISEGAAASGPDRTSKAKPRPSGLDLSSTVKGRESIVSLNTAIEARERNLRLTTTPSPRASEDTSTTRPSSDDLLTPSLTQFEIVSPGPNNRNLPYPYGSPE